MTAPPLPPGAVRTASRPRGRRAGAWVATVGLLLLPLLAPPAAAQGRAGRDPRAQDAMSPREFEQRVNRVRLAVAGAALLLLVVRARRRGRGERGLDLRFSLGLLAATAFATNYNLFLATRLHEHELFHYYLGAKYFPELGYTDLYRCAFVASPENDDPRADRSFAMTDLRTNLRRPAADLLPPVGSTLGCEERFTPERWAAFRSDVGWFHRQMGPAGFRTVLGDHGYNASPVWMLLGRPLAELFPARTRSMWFLARLDLALLVLAFGSLAWAFGWEATCLAVVVWGVNPLSRYSWIGDAYLRQAWLAATLVGVALLRRRRELGAGALLATAALLRVFPVAFSAGLLVRRAWAAVARRRIDGRAVRFLAGALLAAVPLVALSAWSSGRGFEAWRLFAGNLSELTDETPPNGFGLRYLFSLGRLETEAGVELVARGHLFAGRHLLYLACVALLLVLLVRAVRRTPDWEAAVLGGLLIPVLALPVGYYTSCLVPLALPALRRHLLGTALLGTLVLWNVFVLAWHNETAAFAACSATGLALVVLALLLAGGRGGRRLRA